MTISKTTFPEGVADYVAQLGQFRSGKCYIADGSISKSDADTAFANQTSKATELSSKWTELSDLAEKPGKEESKVTKLKTLNYVLEGKRTNTVEINLVGLNQARKAWLENELNNTNRTILLESSGGKDILIFAGLRWSYERSTEFEGLFNVTLSTEYSGNSASKYLIYTNIPEVTQG